MYSFFNNQSTLIKNNELNNFETIQKARKDLIGEIQAIIDYDNHIHSTSDNVAKNTWEKIKLEELNHVGELLGLLDFLDNNQTKYVQDGINEFHQILNDRKNI